MAEEFILAQTAREIQEAINNALNFHKKVSLPSTGNGTDHGTVGQFAVSDGTGGIRWKTIPNAEEVTF